jgi:hypothetical protein
MAGRYEPVPVRYNHGVSEPVSAISVALARFKRLPQRTGEVWQGGIVRFPTWAEDPADPDGPPLRPSGAIWVSLRTGLVHAALAKEGAEATPELHWKRFFSSG